MNVALAPITDRAFRMGERPWTVPLLYKMLKCDGDRIIVAQKALSVVSHLFLAWTIFFILGASLPALPGAAGVLLYAMSPPINAWNAGLISESLALSFCAVWVAAMMWVLAELARDPLRKYLLLTSSTLFVGSSVFFAFTRDNIAYYMPVAALLLLAPGLFWIPLRRRRPMQVTARFILALALVIIFLLQNQTAMTAGRWKIPLVNVICQRVLTNDQWRSDWSARFGMPLDGKLMSHAGQWAHSNGAAIFKHDEFSRWLDAEGIRAYRRHIFAHPLAHLSGIWKSARATVDDFGNFYVRDEGTHSTGARWAGKLIFAPLGAFAPWIWLACLILLLAISLRTGGGLSAVAYAGVILGVILPTQSAICYLADAMEIPRHSLTVTLGLRLMIVMALGCSAAYFSRTPVRADSGTPGE